MSDIKFWKPVYQLFKPDEPLTKDELRDFYVRRDDSPVDGLVNLLAGHRDGGDGIAAVGTAVCGRLHGGMSGYGYGAGQVQYWSFGSDGVDWDADCASVPLA